MKKLRVLLVDDEIMIREGFKKLFDWEAHECVVVGEAADGMEAITKYMQEHLSEDVSLHILSEEFHLNSQYISQLFKNEIGVNFLTYLTNIRMEHAKKLLLSTSLSIAEVSEQSGYGDYRVFTKVFKKSEGITPSQYRRDFLSQ